MDLKKQIQGALRGWELSKEEAAQATDEIMQIITSNGTLTPPMLPCNQDDGIGMVSEYNAAITIHTRVPSPDLQEMYELWKRAMVAAGYSFPDTWDIDPDLCPICDALLDKEFNQLKKEPNQ